ncbi:MAG TPA: response regulator transcription factor [Candidatus Methylomirabilis sp.]|nr:response regulator transcription factor [Candidatus Methylomirabilis sp.]
MIRILIVDDHTVVRRGLKQILTEETDMSVVGEAHNAQEMLALVRKLPCDVIVADISMPGRSGLDVLKELKQDRPKLPVLVLSMHPEDQYAVRALKLGASGYMTKESAPEELVKAIRKVVSGGRYVSPSLAEKLALDLAVDTDRSPHESLSEREHQVFTMIASGKTVKEIADELALSVKTISTYRTRILEKMAMKNNAELIHYAISNRLVG